MVRTRDPRTASVTRSFASGSWSAGWTCTLIFTVTLLAYWPALHGGFIWDDDGHVTRPDLRSLAGLGRIWFEVGATQQYYPVLHSAFWLEHHLWGDAALGYHLLNVLLHATAACWFAILLRRLAVPGCWLAALLFALHPVCVESVAWISEQKNTLSLVFYLAAAYAYLKFDLAGERRWSRYLPATVLFVLALLTKTVTATLPAALLVVCWWQRGRIETRRDLLPLLPWLVLGLVSGLFTAHFERELIGAQGADFDLGLVPRCLLAGRIFWFYLGKLALPAHLMFIYPRWTVDVSAASQCLFPAAALALLGALFWCCRRSRAPLAAGLLFAGALVPALGFFNVFPFVFSYVADHFQYLACLPVFAGVSAGLVQFPRGVPALVRGTAAAALLATLGALTWSQSRIYRDATTLYETTLRQNPGAWLAAHNLAIIYAGSGRVPEAVALEQKVLQVHPDYALAENNLGDDLLRLGRAAEAISHLERAIQLQSNYALAHRNLGMALAMTNRVADALPHFERAAQLDPDDAEAELDWAMALLQTSRLSAAIPHFERSLALNPHSADAQLAFAGALRQLGRTQEAQQHEVEARRLQGPP